jgi:hypothetical protein
MFKIATLGVNALLLLMPILDSSLALAKLTTLVDSRLPDIADDLKDWLSTQKNAERFLNGFKSSQSKLFGRMALFPYLAYVPASKFIQKAVRGYGQSRSSLGGCADLHAPGAIFEANVLGYDIK